MKKLLSFFLLIGQILCQAQEAHYQMGHHALKFSTGKADLLREMAAIGTSAFHSKVGGVSFEQVAVASPTLQGSSISIRYDSTANDSARLVVHIGNGNDSFYRMNIPDWELVPIAKYADQRYNAVVSLFGPDSAVQYNEAFKNTLLGMRMFQADLMFTGMYGLWDLIRDSAGGLVIAESERKFGYPRPDSLKCDTIMAALHYVLGSFHSYILTDWGREVEFDIFNKNFYLTGEPYYLFTNNIYNPVSYLLHAKIAVEGLRGRQEFDDNPHFGNLVRLLSGDSYYGWNLNSVQRTIDTMLHDPDLRKACPGEYMHNVRQLIDSCKAKDTLAYRDFQRDPVFRKLQNLLDKEPTPDNADEASFLIQDLYTMRAAYNHYCARIRNLLRTYQNPSRVLAADPTFKSIRRLAGDGIDTSDATKIRTAIFVLAEKYQYSNDTALEYLGLLYGTPEFDYDTLLIELSLLETTAPISAMDSLYQLGDTTIRLSTKLLLTQSEKMEQLSPLLYTYNPAVYDASVKVMRYAAFLRYVKTQSPENWATFIAAVRRVHVRASTDTTNLASLEVLLTPNHRPY